MNNKFKSEIRKTETFLSLESEPKKIEYLTGYLKGLRKNLYGKNYGDEKSHQVLLGAVNDRDEMRQELGRGYLDGLKWS